MIHKELNTKMVAAAESAGTVLRSRFGIWGLAIISFIESALVVPIITDPFLLAYIVAKKKDVVRAIVVTTFASVAGGVAAYFIAAGFFEVIISPYISEGTQSDIYAIASRFENGVFLLTLTGAITPLPYTFVAVGAGVVQANIFMFILASLIGRGLRYGIEGWLTYKFGDKALAIIKKQVMVATIVCFFLIIAYLMYKLT